MNWLINIFLIPAMIVQYLLRLLASLITQFFGDHAGERFYSIFCHPFQADWGIIVIFPISLLTWISLVVLLFKFYG